MQDTRPLFNNSSPTLQLSYEEERYLKQVLENYRFSQNTGNGVNGRGRGLILFASLWRIAYENRYVTHPLYK